MSSWLNSRARLTPSAMRTAISRRRRMVRASTQIRDVRAGDEQHDDRDAAQPRRDARDARRFRTALRQHRRGDGARAKLVEPCARPSPLCLDSSDAARS